MKIEVAISMGELFDKITILQIKKEKITDKKQVRKYKQRTFLLTTKVLNNDPKVESLTKRLYRINSTLWDIENGKRKCEAESNFGLDFVRLARDVYLYKDKRAEVKKRLINIHTNSDIVEEKAIHEIQINA